MNSRLLYILLAAALANAAAAQSVSPVTLDALQCEHQVNPIGIGETQPRLSWKLVSDRPGEVQTAYEIRAASSAAALAAGTADLWDSNKVASDQSVLVPWAGAALHSRSQVFWQVRVWDKDGQPTAWSDPASFELGLLNPPSEWKGQWITADLPRYDIEAKPLSQASWINAGSDSTQAAGIRLTVNLPADVKINGASVDVAADGLIALYVNGKATKQGGSSHTAPFHADFGPQLAPGKNLLAIGSNAVRLSRGGGTNAIAAHVVIDLDNGQRLEFNTDGSWKAAIVPNPVAVGRRGGPPAAPSPDAKWFTTDYDDSHWAAATVLGPYEAIPAIASADSTIGPGRYLRKTFTVKGPIARARLYSTAFGIYEASINGHAVNDHQFDPGFTDYYKRVMVQATDVTSLLKPGPNAVGALLGDGWLAGRLGWMGLAQYKLISDHPLFNAQLEITYADGTTDVVATDNTWKGGPGEVVGADEQLGEVLDARKAVDWNQPTFDDSAWSNATVEDHSAVPAMPDSDAAEAPSTGIAFVPQVGPPVRRLIELTPKTITHQGDLWLVDFGQNMVGHVRLTAQGPAGTTITVSHGEMLNSDGTLYTENLRPAISLDQFTLKGGGAPETFEPTFTFHGFRYAAITGYPGELTADNIRGIVVGSDNPATGHIETSNKDLNQLFSNIVWGQRGNFLSIPTDCPQRDERLGWMGDAQVFAPTAARNADVSAFFTKWMADVDDAQGADGAFSTVSPRANQNQSYPVWGDAGVLIPWDMYLAYGDKKFLEDNYAYMARWVVHNYNSPTGLLLNGGVGDHLAPPPDRPAGGAAPAGGFAGFGAGGTTNVVDTAYFANSAKIVARAATLLGRPDDAAAYNRIAGEVTDAFNAAFVSPDGTIANDNQVVYVLALQFDLLPENLRAAAAQKLVDNINQIGHLTTGFPGSSLLCPALTKIGHSDAAWKLVFNDKYPSWLFPVKNGATTIWERWDGWTPDKGFQDSTMNSFNHYSFGAVGYWFYAGAGGILVDEASPGYKHFLLQPQITSLLTYFKATLDSPYGLISSYWHAEGDQMDYDVTVPPNSSATLSLSIPPQQVEQSGQPVSSTSATATTLDLPAGTYHFTFPKSLIQ